MGLWPMAHGLWVRLWIVDDRDGYACMHDKVRT